ncbi:aminoglycoside phosphotransferase family protein [Actinomadura sp. CNU-125]|uniref:aminoglycoside phosphotransferase family protein n=1 Tax=Actinomadura sp. CNU-125 TaxID=1904961 RepID=UPI00096AACDA|nr:aminoglycoside phosphotransferase family protein [Actinomadura sp. CNU-125]
MSAPNTHDVTLKANVVVKTYQVRAQDASIREWRTLNLLERYAPDLAPRPLEADLAADPPYVVMSRLPGVPLQALATREQAEAMAGALRRMQDSVPQNVLASVPARAGTAPEFIAGLRNAYGQEPRLGSDALVVDALRVGSHWLAQPQLDRLAVEVEPVLGSGDGNAANYLWDGEKVRAIDFEYAGRSDRWFELAEVVEHVSVWVGAGIDAEWVMSCFEPSPAQARRLHDCRRLLALYWLLALLPDSPGHNRNPPGTVQRQARRALDLLS